MSPTEEDISTAAQSVVSYTIAITPNMAATELASELRKIRDLLNRAYRNALLEDKMNIAHPAMQGLMAATVNVEGSANAVDPPRVLGAVDDRVVRGMGRA
ncbi:MAG TPA: hypothetical protein VN861_03285 [Candidatus Acidoferrales bacterium]|nr:hypothetical protein [Candidatus Acidoferrales bacterium]